MMKVYSNRTSLKAIIVDWVRADGLTKSIGASLRLLESTERTGNRLKITSAHEILLR